MMVRIKIARIILQGNSAHLVGTVSKEVNLLEVFVSDMAETEGLVPARREDIKGDLSTNCIGETVVCELLSQNINEFLTQLVYLLQGNHTMSGDRRRGRETALYLLCRMLRIQPALQGCVI